jgi:5-carboxymethyl-2-hydroxymuconate isomerase
MKLISYFYQGSYCWGCVVGENVIDIGRHMPEFTSLSALLNGGNKALERARVVAKKVMHDHTLNEVQLLMPLPEPRRIFCIGVNYSNRNAEYKDGSDLPKYPSIFMRVSESFVAHAQPLIQPLESQQLDYEGEIGIVIGRSARRVTGEDALSCIAGLTCINEGTIRDWVHHAKFNVTQGKNFSASGAIGPWLVTADEFPQGYSNLRLQTRVNGELRQDDTTGNLMFDFAYLIGYLSTFTTLAPGDIIATGTPIGAGIRFDPPRFLKPGDVVEIEVQGVGVLSNTVQAEGVAA